MLAGARIIKTGLAVTISLIICNLLNVQPGIFAAAATVLNLQPSVSKSIVNAREQLSVHFLSIGVAIAFGLSIGANPLTMGLATILIIYLCNRLKLKSTISGGVMAAIFILGAPEAEFLSHALTRSSAIFIGVGTALAVNLTIAPPRYRQPLIEKLLELNASIDQAYVQAVDNYLELRLLGQEDYTALSTQVESKFREVSKIFERYQTEGVPFSPGRAQENDSRFFNDYLAYNKGLWQRTKDIIFLGGERIERRKDAGDLPISTEFQDILVLLREALSLYTRHNHSLRLALQGNPVELPEEPHIWSKLDCILNHWHSRFPSGSYYLHALIEVSLITYKIRWAAKEAVRLIAENAPMNEGSPV